LFFSPRKQKELPVELSILGRLRQWRLLKPVKRGVCMYDDLTFVRFSFLHFFFLWMETRILSLRDTIKV
jgi:hypothetical protein